MPLTIRPRRLNVREAAAGFLVALCLCLLASCAPALAQSPPLPALTGRVVDGAGVIPADRRAALDAKLKAHEDKTTDQVVVATVASLGGTSVEDYANRLFRAWQLGAKAKNNGVLLLVAPTDRKVRIETGYGLEGALTDAVSGIIVRTAMTPKFKAGDYPGGIDAGVDAILSVLSGDADEWQRRAVPRSQDEGLSPQALIALLVIIVAALLIMRTLTRSWGGRPHLTRGGSWVVGSGFGTGWSGGGGFSGGGFGGGFSGGGGSSGGGGASGSW